MWDDFLKLIYRAAATADGPVNNTKAWRSEASPAELIGAHRQRDPYFHLEDRFFGPTGVHNNFRGDFINVQPNSKYAVFGLGDTGGRMPSIGGLVSAGDASPQPYVVETLHEVYSPFRNDVFAASMFPLEQLSQPGFDPRLTAFDPKFISNSSRLRDNLTNSRSIYAGTPGVAEIPARNVVMGGYDHGGYGVGGDRFFNLTPGQNGITGASMGSWDDIIFVDGRAHTLDWSQGLADPNRIQIGASAIKTPADLPAKYRKTTSKPIMGAGDI